MRRLLAAALLLATAASAQSTPDPRIASIIGDLAKTRTPLQVALSPDGKLLAWAGANDLHLVATAAVEQDRVLSPDTASKPANTALSACRSSDPIWSADSTQLAFLSECDKQGINTAQSQIWIFTPANNTVRQLTHLTGRLSKPEFSPDGNTIAFLFVQNGTRSAGALDAMKPAIGVIGEDNVEVQTVKTVDVATGYVPKNNITDLYIYEFSWSPDSKRIAYTAAPSPGENNWWVARLYVVGIDPSKPLPNAKESLLEPRILVDPTTIPGTLHGLQLALPRFSPDGKNIAFLGGLMSDFGSNGGDLYITSSEGKDTHPFTEGRKASIAWFQWLNSEHVLISERERGKVHVAVLGTSGHQLPFTSQNFDGTVGSGESPLSLSVSLSTRNVAFFASSFEKAPEVYFGTPGNLHQVTHLNDALKPSWGKSESIEYTNDGFNLQGFLLYPAHYDPAKKYGLITYVHGGPSGSNASTWPMASFGPAPFSALDYFVFLPNPRGSFGQGETFTQANRKDFGYGDLRDILVGLDLLEKKLPIDPAREGITGWSYGGYMTMFAVTQTHRFHAAVAGAGIANWLSYYGENSIDQWMTPFFGDTVYNDPAIYAKSSPITFIKEVRTPTLIVVGDRDGECPAPQSFEFWHALRALNVPSELVVYPNEGHHFRDPAHRIDVLTRALNWFNSQMPPQAPQSVSAR
jgi:dipeptidyl aminopeptidase/acylaminoacyl peptidase